MEALTTRFSRRRAGLLGAGALATLVAGCAEDQEPGAETQELGAPDLDVVDFALGLERLERDFYDRVLEGGLLSGQARRLATQIRANEREHVALLQTVLQTNGRTPSPPPRLDRKVLDVGEDEVLSLATKLEDLGANALSGAAATILSRQVLKAALSIHSVEARHAAALHRLRGTEFVPEGAFATPLDRNQALEELAPFVL